MRTSFRGRSDWLTMKTDHAKGIPGYMGVSPVEPVKVIVTPKSGTDGFRWWRVATSIDGKASGRVRAKGETVGTVSKVELSIDSWEGRFGLWMGCAGRPKPALTGGVKSTDVVQLIEILGVQTDDTFAVASIDIASDRTKDLFGASGSSGEIRYRNVRSSCGRLLTGSFIPEAALRSSTLPAGRLSSTFDTRISQLAYGVMSMSSEAIIVGFVGDVFGLEYLTLALIAG